MLKLNLLVSVIIIFISFLLKYFVRSGVGPGLDTGQKLRELGHKSEDGIQEAEPVGRALSSTHASNLIRQDHKKVCIFFPSK